MTGSEAVEDFIETWSRASGSERSLYQVFVNGLCDLIGVEKVGAEHGDEYRYERQVTRRYDDGPGTPNYIDLYKRECFVLEAKQSKKREPLNVVLPPAPPSSARDQTTGKRGGRQFDTLMRNARNQAEGYAKSLPAEEGWPPFLVIVDVGHVIELYADFSLQGKHYAQYPDRQSYRIYLEDLRRKDVRERLRLVWEDPHALDPARETAEVTREIAQYLAELSKSLERRAERALPEDTSAVKRAELRRAHAERVAMFLMRCLFTMFAEDVGLVAQDSFRALLERYRGRADRVHLTLTQLWREMDAGGFSPILEQDLKRFNGGLFRNAEAIQLDEDELKLLIVAAGRDWRNVEPAIFGTLLEQALDEHERHKLGAHYTPRAYVERLVVATVIEPLTEDWNSVQAAATKLWREGKQEAAREEVRGFHRKLCETRVLDPACGTGNFLYVTMELMKRLEGEVLETLEDLGENQYLLEMDSHTVDPHQFLGLELNPRAVAIAELVLWIGFLQWHYRTRGKVQPAEPVLKNFRNIREQDAVLTYDGVAIRRDEAGRPMTRWDGRTMKPHPVTAEPVPDDAARIELLTYRNPQVAPWPHCEFVVGNPPFLGGKDIRADLGDGYAEACWKARPHIPGGADFVMHFWDKAAELARAGKIRRFGLITTNSITQTFSRRVIEHHMAGKKPVALMMAIPDHPWMKSADRAAVRIAMTVGVKGQAEGVLRRVVHESGLNTDSPTVMLDAQEGQIWSNLRLGADLSKIVPLRANDKVCSPGVKLHGAGFIVTPEEARRLGLGTVPGLENHIREYRNGRDLAHRPRGVMVIDLYPLSEQDVRSRFPAVYQWVYDRVRPERLQNRETFRREFWWWFGRTHRDYRAFTQGLETYIATVETSKHRFFVFLDGQIRADNKLCAIGLSGPEYLAILSSAIHVRWSLDLGGRLGVGNDPVYVKTACFDPFPFPNLLEGPLNARLRDLGERLDAHRKAVLARHEKLTMTGLYNVLEKLRAGTPLTATERTVYDDGLVGVLNQLHDEIDAAVAEAYGWPADLTDEEIMVRLVALNRERAAEERAGKVRWLRPEFQAPTETAERRRAEQIEADLVPMAAADTGPKPKLPTKLPDQVAAVRALLMAENAPIHSTALARRFVRSRTSEQTVAQILETLTILGQTERVRDGYVMSR